MARGVAAEQLVFAPKLPPDQHLARHRLADLFLDTLPYNAHTTCSDALWAGLPVVTCYGKTFPGRVAASLLKAIDLPELVTMSPEKYEELALELARNPDLLKATKEKLARNRTTTPLFDSERFRKTIEAAYEAMLA
jgi:predicted O-linked N-acetylglucosamine transferase (SPINDLY family)